MNQQESKSPARTREQDTVHPRLKARREQLGSLLNLDDPTEVTAALQELETLLVRCGYHVALARHDRASFLSKRRRSRRSPPTSIGAARRGRPPGSSNWANRQLGLGLATIWFQFTGQRATRRVDSYGDGREYGPYRNFVECVVSALPRRLRATRKGHVPEVDHLVRVSLTELEEAKVAPEESRRRGLLDEGRWNRGAGPAGG